MVSKCTLRKLNIFFFSVLISIQNTLTRKTGSYVPFIKFQGSREERIQ